MEDLFSRIVENLAGRLSGPMKFRLVLQPVMAAIFALEAGMVSALGLLAMASALFRWQENPYDRA